MNFIFGSLEKWKVIAYFLLEGLLDFIYYIVPFSFTMFLTLPFTVEKALIVMLIFVSARTFHIIGNYILTIFGDNFLYNYSNVQYQEFYKKVSKLPTETISKYQTGYFENMIEKVSTLVRKILTAEYTSIIVSFVFLFYTLYEQSIAIFEVSLITCTISVFLNIKIIEKANNQVEELYEQEYEYSSVYNDFINNIRTVKLLNNYEYFCKKIKREGQKCYNANKKYIKSYALEEVLRNFFIMIPFVLGLLKAVIDLSHGLDTLGIITFYISLQVEMDFIFSELSSTIISAFELKAIKKRLSVIFKRLDMRDETDKFDEMRLDNIVIEYPSSNMEIMIGNLSVKRGDKICIIGQSGQGKTSTINLILGNLSTYKGDASLDGRSLRDIKLDIGVVSQEIELFNMTIKENLCLDKRVSDESIEKLLIELGLQDILELDKGIHTVVGEKGLKLSTGQKRRLNLLRSYLMEKNVYILDEPLSNLDSQTEKVVIAFILKYFKDKTLVIITHSDEIRKICNKFYEFKDHKLVEERAKF